VLVFHSDISLFIYTQWQCMIHFVIVLMSVFSFVCVRFEILVAVQLRCMLSGVTLCHMSSAGCYKG
jgi:hypothetical protein